VSKIYIRKLLFRGKLKRLGTPKQLAKIDLYRDLAHAGVPAVYLLILCGDLCVTLNQELTNIHETSHVADFY